MIPTLGNPTSHLMGAGRRIAIAEIARRYDVCVIEDEVYKPILEEKLPSMPELLPDLGFFVTSFTKTVMTGLRTGYLVVPTQYSIRVTSILRVTSWSGVNLMGEMASRWIEDGTATELIEIQRSELRSRQAQVTDILGSHVAGNNPLSLCAWLKIPRNWSEDGLVRALANKGVAVTPSDPFVAGADRGSGGIRICLGDGFRARHCRRHLRPSARPLRNCRLSTMWDRSPESQFLKHRTQELFGACLARGLEYLFRRALLADTPLIEKANAIRYFPGKSHFMRDKEHGQVMLLCQPAND